MQRRRIYFIEKGFQTWFIVKFCLVVIAGALITMGLLYFFAARTTTVSFENTRAVVKSTADFILPVLIQTLIIVTLTVAIFTIMLTLYVSHKIGGPVYRFKRELELITQGDLSSEFRIRKNDQFQDLAGLLNLVKRKLRDEISVIKKDLEELESVLHSLPEGESKNKVSELVERIKQRIEKFKT
jgi:methyl-accepting chemotaxis protein